MKARVCICLISVLSASVPLEAQEREAARPDARARFLSVLDSRFLEWDADADGVLSVREIDARVADGNVKAEAASAAAALKRASRMKKLALPDFTKEHLVELAGRTATKEWPGLPEMFSGGLSRIENARRVLFASGRPRLETVHQGRMGNCFSLAPLGALAFHRPDFIVKEMIRERPDGRFDVILGKQTVCVSAPTDAELAMTATNESDGFWVNVYEKAAGEARNDLKPENERAATGLDALSRGGSAGTMLAFITGHEMVRFSCKFARDPKTTPEIFEHKLAELRTALIGAVKEKRLMTCGTTTTNIPGVTPNHAYAVLGYDPSCDTIRCWNPHGTTTSFKGEPGPAKGYPMTDGIFEMPLPVFVKEFSGLAFEVLPLSGTKPAGRSETR